MNCERESSGPPAGYYSWCRPEIIEEVAEDVRRVLSIGCGEGATEAVLAGQGIAVFGVEKDAAAAARAREHLAGVIVGDIEEIDVPFEAETFDCLICADVLEHLRWPRQTLARLVPLLRPGGQVIVSLPNVRFYGVSLALVFTGSWAYQAEGILDMTHLRFFTLRSACELLTLCGLTAPVVRRVYRATDPYNRSRVLERVGGAVLPFARRAAGLRDLFAYQYVLVARERL